MEDVNEPGTLGFSLEEARAHVSTLERLSHRSWTARLAWKIGRRLSGLPTLEELDELERKLDDHRERDFADLMDEIFGGVDEIDRQYASDHAHEAGISEEAAFASIEAVEICQTLGLAFERIELVSNGSASVWIVVAIGNSGVPLRLKLPRASAFLQERLEAIETEHREDA